MRVTDLLALSHVPRWSNVRHSPPQSVADHSFRVATIYVELCSRLNKTPTLKGLTYALFHDGMEAYTGDIPGDFKRDIKEKVAEVERKLGVVLYEEPTEADKRLVKLADKIETYTFIRVNGVGPHSRRIVEIIEGELVRLCDEFPNEEEGSVWSKARMLTYDIIEETGRD